MDAKARTEPPLRGAVRGLALLVLVAFATLAQAQTCDFTIAASTTSFVAAGGTGAITVTASSADCARSAAASVPWITFPAGQQGSGGGTVSFAVAANTTQQSRSGVITIAEESVTVTQAGDVCSFAVSPSSISIGAAASDGGFDFTTTPTCAWAASTATSWLQISSATSGFGSGRITFLAAANTGKASRSGSIQLGSKSVAVNQPGTCSYALSSASQFTAAAGDSGSFNVIASGGCAWTASASASWISITAGRSGVDNGAVSFSVAQNTGAARSGTISVSGATFTVTQAGTPCNFTLLPTSVAVPLGGGAGSIAVSAAASCSWQTSPTVNWVTVTSGASGTGNGNVVYNVAANTSQASRTGTIAAGDQVFTLIQPGVSCKYAVTPIAKDFPASGGGAVIRIAASGACSWNAVANAVWITFPSGIEGVGNGTVAINVAPNPDFTARTALVIVGDQSLVVSEAAAPCVVALPNTGANVDYRAGAGSFDVTSGCSWTTAARSLWLTVTSGAGGSGNAPVSYSFTANPTAAPRSGSIAVGNLSFSVLQAPAPCNLSLSGSETTVPAAGGGGTVQITALNGCAWTPTADASWIGFTWNSVNGSGSIRFSADANPSTGVRSGHITVSGQNFTITQPAAAIQILPNILTNAASYASGAVAPGLIVTLFAPGIGPPTPVSLQLTSDRRLATLLGDTRVLFDDIPAPMVAASSGQISAIVPYAVAGKASTRVQIEYRRERSNPVTVPVVASQPALFTLDSSGAGPGAILNQNATLNTEANPAAKSAIVSLFATGEGHTAPAGADGRLAAAPLPKPVLPVTAKVDGIDADVTYAGAAQGLVSGLIQVNVRIPAGAGTGAIPVVVRVGQADSQPGVTIWVR